MISTHAHIVPQVGKFADWHLVVNKEKGDSYQPNNENASWNNSPSQNLRYPPNALSGRSMASVLLEEQLKKIIDKWNITETIQNLKLRNIIGPENSIYSRAKFS